jgi:arylsulfatase A-like enzyme
MTGCYPIRVAEPGNRKNQHTILHPKEITMAEVLREAGYATSCIGKWHLGRDFAASFATLAGVKLPDNACGDSFNILPALLGEEGAKGRTELLQQGNDKAATERALMRN